MFKHLTPLSKVIVAIFCISIPIALYVTGKLLWKFIQW